MTLMFAEAHQRFRHLDWIRGALGGVLAAFVGMLVMVLVRLGELVWSARLQFGG